MDSFGTSEKQYPVKYWIDVVVNKARDSKF